MNTLDRIITYISPQRALKRIQTRAAINYFDTGSSYTGASRTKRSLRGWGLSNAWHPDLEVLPEHELLRGRSRSLYRNNPIARGAINLPVSNVIGSGLVLHSRIDRSVLGMSDEEADAWESKTERLFQLWASYTDADAERRQDFYGLQSLAFLSVLQSGEVFALLPLIPRSGTISNLRIQLLESDQVSNPNGAADTVDVSGGIETGKYNEPIAYWVETTASWMSVQRTWQRVAAYGGSSGRQNVIHLYTLERPRQRRGVPYLTPVLDSLKQVSRYTDAELMAAVISSFFTVFIKTPSGDSDILNTALPDNLKMPESSEQPKQIEMGSGAVMQLADGEDVTFANPTRPNAQFEPFVQAMIRQMGMALGLPYEVLVQHFSSSYSASRAALMEAWRFFKERRTWLARRFCQPIYEEWLSDMISSGKIDAPGFFDDISLRRAYAGSQWIGPTQGQIDPMKEASAASSRVENGFSTVAEETEALTGMNWEQNFRQRAKEIQLAKNLNIPIGAENSETNPRVTETGVIPPGTVDEGDLGDSEGNQNA